MREQTSFTTGFREQSVAIHLGTYMKWVRSLVQLLNVFNTDIIPKNIKNIFSPIRPGLFEGAWTWGTGVGGGGGGRVSAVYNSKTINYVEMKFDGAVENHKLINLV